MYIYCHLLALPMIPHIPLTSHSHCLLPPASPPPAVLSLSAPYHRTLLYLLLTTVWASVSIAVYGPLFLLFLLSAGPRPCTYKNRILWILALNLNFTPASQVGCVPSLDSPRLEAEEIPGLGMGDSESSVRACPCRRRSQPDRRGSPGREGMRRCREI